MDEISQLKDQLDYVNATRQRRQEMADHILGHPHLIPSLMEIALEDSTQMGSRACWILEFVFKADPGALYPHLDRLTRGLHGVRPESSIRPLAKICEMLVTSHYEPKATAARPPLEEHHRAAMTEACFDWLMSAEKVAPKAYSMQALLLLGREIPWVHGELRAILEQQYPQGSPAYQARARQVLRKLS